MLSRFLFARTQSTLAARGPIATEGLLKNFLKHELPRDTLNTTDTLAPPAEYQQRSVEERRKVSELYQLMEHNPAGFAKALETVVARDGVDMNTFLSGDGLKVLMQDEKALNRIIGQDGRTPFADVLRREMAFPEHKFRYNSASLLLSPFKWYFYVWIVFPLGIAMLYAMQGSLNPEEEKKLLREAALGLDGEVYADEFFRRFQSHHTARLLKYGILLTPKYWEKFGRFYRQLLADYASMTETAFRLKYKQCILDEIDGYYNEMMTKVFNDGLMVDEDDTTWVTSNATVLYDDYLKSKTSERDSLLQRVKAQQFPRPGGVPAYVDTTPVADPDDAFLAQFIPSHLVKKRTSFYNYFKDTLSMIGLSKKEMRASFDATWKDVREIMADEQVDYLIEMRKSFIR